MSKHTFSSHAKLTIVAFLNGYSWYLTGFVIVYFLVLFGMQLEVGKRISYRYIHRIDEMSLCFFRRKKFRKNTRLTSFSLKEEFPELELNISGDWHWWIIETVNEAFPLLIIDAAGTHTYMYIQIYKEKD